MWTNLWEHLVFSPLSSRSSGSRHSSYCSRSSISKCLTISWTLRGPLGSSCPCQSLPAPGPLDPLWPPAEMPSQPAPSASELEGRGRRTLCWESSCWGATRLPTQTNPGWRFDGFAGTETASLGASGSRHSWRSDVAQSDASPFTLHNHTLCEFQHVWSDDLSQPGNPKVSFLCPIYLCVSRWHKHPHTLGFQLDCVGQCHFWAKQLSLFKPKAQPETLAEKRAPVGRSAGAADSVWTPPQNCSGSLCIHSGERKVAFQWNGCTSSSSQRGLD